MMPPPPDPPNRISYAPREFLDSYYESGDEPDMPNFDAMPQTHMGPIDEMGLDTPRPIVQTAISPSVTSPGGAYSPYTPDSAHGIPHSHSQPNMHNTDGLNQFENAGFQFDIPAEPPRQLEKYMPHSYEANGAPPYQNQPRAPEPQQDPDALPSHPTPFRPGLDQKPPPVRNYNNAPAPAPVPAPGPAPAQAALATAATQPARPVSMGPTPVTQEELQQLQQKVRGNPSDQATQLLLAKKLVEAATVLVGDNNRLDPKTKAKAKEKYILDAYKIVKKLVQAGYPDAQFYLADCYGEGQLGLEADPKEAFALYHSAAKNGHAQSAYRVAVCSEIGQEEGGGTKRDPFKAVQWYKRAAALGDTPAMYKMGMIHLKGLLGQARNPREGVSWLKRAAERADEENPHALHELALMYQTAGGNDVIIRDEKYANQLFHQAADLGYKFSQFRLGTAYEYGLMGNPVDNRMSIIWYTRAAAQGEHQSELALSGWYLTGSEGILQQNDTEAYLWARKAATAGLAKAEYAMGYFTEVGIGVTANLEDAKRWYWRAAAQGFPKARERLEDLKKGGGRMQKTRLSRSAVNKQSDGDCILM
jgi:TPR repeat protein